MIDSRFAVLLRQSTPTELVEFLASWAVETLDGQLFLSSKAEWGYPAVHLELLKEGEPPFPVQIPSEFVLAIVDTSIDRPCLGFVRGNQ